MSLRPYRPRGAALGVVLAALSQGAIGLAQTESTASEASNPEALEARRTEVGLLPAINYNSDLGFGFGALAAIAQFSPGFEPFEWRIEALAYATLMDGPSGLDVPFQSHYVRIDKPDFIQDGLRLNGTIAFQRFSEAAYHGFGSRSVRIDGADDGTDAERRFHDYDRMNPEVSASLRVELLDRPVPVGKERLEFFAGTRLLYNDLNIYEGSALARDVALRETDSPDGQTMRDLLFGTSDHVLWMLNAGLLLDTRDHEFVPARGTFSELSIRFSPGVDDDLVFGGFAAVSSWFWSLYKRILVLAARAAFDFQVGDVPFYELSLFGAFLGGEGPGGGRAVRGVLLQRYAGRIKALGNLELRGRLLPFRVFGQRLNLGLTAFVDAGRVWADTRTRRIRGRSLDGPFSDFSVGVGGGLRLQWGETFLIRADLAQAVTEGTTGFYIDVGQAF